MNDHSTCSKTYKASIYRGAGKVDIVDLPYPECGDDDAIVKNLMSGICGSDINAWKTDGEPHMIWRDHEFGHEMVSEVVEIGKNVKGLKVGDHVFPNLGYAKRDRRRMATVGGFSEYIHLPQCEVSSIENPNQSAIKIDNSIPLKEAVLLEPFSVGTRGIKSLNPGPGKTVIVFGAGIVGMSAAVMAKWYGCDEVMIVDISEYRLENAKALGIKTCNPGTQDLQERAFEVFGSQPGMGGDVCNADLYIDGLGMQVSADNFFKLAKREARFAIVGVNHHPISMPGVSLCYMNYTITGCGNAPLEELAQDIMEMMKSRKFDTSILVSHEYGITQIADALTMGANAKEAQKVCIAYV